MTIQQTTSIVFITEDGVHHTTHEDAVEHQFRVHIERWSQASCYSGMSREDVVTAIVDDRARLAAIFKEYVK